MTVLGAMFVTSDYSSRSGVGASQAMSTLWTSSSAIRSKSGEGSMHSRTVLATMGGSVGSLIGTVSYGIGYVSSVVPRNVAATGSHSVTLIG